MIDLAQKDGGHSYGPSLIIVVNVVVDRGSSSLSVLEFLSDTPSDFEALFPLFREQILFLSFYVFFSAPLPFGNAVCK